MVAILCDPSLGRYRGDVDDVLALLYLIRRGVRISGIAAVEGNADARHAYQVAESVARASGEDIPVYPSPKAVRGEETAVDFLRSAISEGEDVIAMSPLTYLAEALRKVNGPFYSRIFIMGGSIRQRALAAFPEFNFWKDALAARRVLEAPWREVHVIPLDFTATVKWDCGRLVRSLREISMDLNDPLIKLVAGGIVPWCRTSTTFFGGLVPHDVLAVIYYDRADLFKVSERRLTVEVKGLFKKGRLTESEGARPLRLVNGLSAGSENLLDLFLAAIRGGKSVPTRAEGRPLV